MVRERYEADAAACLIVVLQYPVGRTLTPYGRLESMSLASAGWHFAIVWLVDVKMRLVVV